MYRFDWFSIYEVINNFQPQLTETDASYVVFVGISQRWETTETILLLSGLLTHRRTVSHCLFCRITVAKFLILRAISRNFAQFRTVSRNFDSYPNYCLECRVMGVLRLDRLVHTSTTSTREGTRCFLNTLIIVFAY